jgi:hypothetical protein
VTGTTCPRCGESVLLDGGAVRAICLSCDLVFDVLPAQPVGEGPLRQIEVVLPAHAPPPTRHIRQIDRKHFRIAQAGPTVPAVVVLFAICYVVPALVSPAIPFAIGLGAIVLFWWLDGREEIEIDGARVLVSRSMLGLRSTREVSRDAIVSIDDAGLHLRDGTTIPLARNLGHRPESLEWLRSRLSRALQLAA